MKKRVLLVNKFYYRRGGDCVYTLALERVLRGHGHDVAVWSMHHPLNDGAVYETMFASQVAFDGSFGLKLKAAARALGYLGIKGAFARMLDSFRPDVVHLNNIHSYLSPVIADVARRRGIKVVWTLHDYKLLCPAYSCLCRGEVCEDCFDNKAHVLWRRCMKDALPASVLAFAEAVRWRRSVLTRAVDMFICPSRFMRDKMEQGGFPSGKLVHLPNFISSLHVSSSSPRDDYYCYVGRLSPEKGVGRLLEVAASMRYRLRVIGDGPLEAELRERYGSCGYIRFCGHCDANEVARQLSCARFSILPSECYENSPLAAIESLCAGTPVVGAAIGGIPELISDDSDGLCFAPFDGAAMSQAICEAFSRDWDHDMIMARAADRFSSRRYYSSLIEIYGR